ncbi:MAG: hypothetical protein LBE72_00515, partial [Rickettsia sp.]|nr:hypothetical protein [Rickettsia sp.]
KQAIREAQAHASSVRSQTLAQWDLIGAIKTNSTVQAINNKLQNQRAEIQQRLTVATIKQSIVDSLAATKLKLLNGRTSVAALYQINYTKAKERSLIASIRNAVALASEHTFNLLLSGSLAVHTAALRIHNAVKNFEFLAYIKSGAAKVAEHGFNLLLVGSLATFTAMQRIHNAVKNSEILTYIRSRTVKLADHGFNLLLSGSLAIHTAAQRIHNAVKNQGILLTLRDIAAKGLLALTNVKTAISAGIMTAAQIGLNAAMMASPYGLIVVALIAMAAAFKYLYDMFPDFKSGINEIADGFKELFNALMSGDFNKIGDIFQNALSQLPGWLGNINNQIEPALTAMADAFSSWATNVDWLDEIQKGFGDISAWLMGATKNVSKWLVDGLKGISEGLSGWLDGAGAGGQEVGQAIYDGLVGWWEANGDTIVEILSTIFLEIIPLLGEIGLKIMEALGLAIYQGLEWIGQQIAVAWENNISKPFWDWLYGIPEWATQLATQGLSAGSQFVNSMVTFVRQLPTILWTFLLVTIARVVQFGSNLISKAQSIFSNVVNTAKSFVIQLPGIVWTEMMNIVAKIDQASGAIFNKVKQVFGNVVKWAMEALGMSSPGTISKMIGKEMGWTLEHIKDMANPAKKAAESLGKKILSGFGSPSFEIDAKSGETKWKSKGSLSFDDRFSWSKPSGSKDSGTTIIEKIDSKLEVHVHGDVDSKSRVEEIYQAVRKAKDDILWELAEGLERKNDAKRN